MLRELVVRVSGIKSGFQMLFHTSKLDMGWVMIRKGAKRKILWTTSTSSATWTVQKKWYLTFCHILCFSMPDKCKAWHRKEKEERQQKKKKERKMISYSYPHPNRPPPLPPSYKESEEGLTIQVVNMSFCKFFVILREVFLNDNFFEKTDNVAYRADILFEIEKRKVFCFCFCLFLFLLSYI